MKDMVVCWFIYVSTMFAINLQIMLKAAYIQLSYGQFTMFASLLANKGPLLRACMYYRPCCIMIPIHPFYFSSGRFPQPTSAITYTSPKSNSLSRLRPDLSSPSLRFSYTLLPKANAKCATTAPRRQQRCSYPRAIHALLSPLSETGKKRSPGLSYLILGGPRRAP
jgi:hypothetical protein